MACEVKGAKNTLRIEKDEGKIMWEEKKLLQLQT